MTVSWQMGKGGLTFFFAILTAMMITSIRYYSMDFKQGVYVLVYVIAQAGVKFGINFTSCSENGNFAVNEWKFHSCPCYHKLIL